MNRWRLLFAAMTLGTLCACAAQPGTTTSPTDKGSSVQVASLPCAEVGSTDSVTILYPTETIYRSGAALPKETGLVCLEELADWLNKTPQNHWQVIVAGEEGFGFDPLELAGKRQELLQRFFARKGLEPKDWEWQMVAGQSEQLQFLELKDSP